MRKLITYITGIVVLTPLFFFTSCEEFLDPEQELKIKEEQLFDDWYEYRSVEMGMYGLQQDLVEQILVLGELRGDLLTITPNANADMVEVYNFSVSKDNKYASPTNFFKLIASANNFIRILERERPEVLDPESPVTNYDKLYGEALCMRAWAYFTAVQIYGKVPYIHESLVTMEEIQDFVNSPVSYVDSVYIEFSVDGYYNDTTYNRPVELEKNLYDTEMIIDLFTEDLEENVKAVGVNHYIDNNDETWEISIWNTYAMHALLGQMYLTRGNYVKAAEHFEDIIISNIAVSDDDENLQLRYQLDNSFAYSDWRNIFTNIDNREHIFSLWFNKTYFQQNRFQRIFENSGPHKYMLKPSQRAIDIWETVWRNATIDYDNDNPDNTKVIEPGFPSDFYRGYGSSYIYLRSNGMPINTGEYIDMLQLRARGDDRSSRNIMEGVDTLVYKYSINKTMFDEDANFIVYRAADIHLYLAEIYTYWEFVQTGNVRPSVSKALGLVNDGSYYGQSAAREQLGVRGRVGLGWNEDDAISITNIIYEHDPYTNKIVGYRDLTGNLREKQLYLEEQILDERARELAYEGKRFYDLIRVAKKRNDPSFLAEKVSSKYPPGKREQIYALLLDENNWYINYFE
jgi:hypothetical protein